MARLWVGLEKGWGVIWNVDSAVGAPPSPNLPEDVLLVQFCIDCLHKDPILPCSVDDILIYAGVLVNGQINEATIKAIRYFQSGGSNPTRHILPDKVDGRVSPIPRNCFAPFQYAIARLNVSLDHRTPLWPRIDQTPGCPPLLANMVRREVYNQGGSLGNF